MNSIDIAGEGDMAAVEAILQLAGLPTEGFRADVDRVLVVRRGDDIVGCAALELLGKNALLRSVAVRPDQRGLGVGAELVKASLQLAAGLRDGDVYLVTETAEDYFPRYGFHPVERTEVPPAVLASREITHLCPGSATVMRRPRGG